MLLPLAWKHSGLIRMLHWTIGRAAHMSDGQFRQGMLDTNILILRKCIDPAELPEEMAISAITLTELSAGPHEVRRGDEQDAHDQHAERARRLEIPQRIESGFDPVPFDAEAARTKADTGRIIAALEAILAQYPGENDLANGEEWL